ncbi:hypothetical protein Tco_1143898 [Tanacetum coccineum]
MEYIQDTVMSDSDESTITYTEVSSPFEGLSNIGLPGVVRHEHKGLPWMLDDTYVQVALQAPPSPDYIPGLEEPQSPPLPDFIPEPVYLEYMPQEDEVFSGEEQPLSAAASPTAQSPDYVSESDPEENPEEDDDEDPEEDLVDYPADRGDDGDDKDEPSDDDEDEEVDIEADDEEKEEHPAHADSTTLLYQLPIRPHLRRRQSHSRLTISPPLPQIPSPPLPVSSPVPVLSPSLPVSLIPPLGYQAAMIRLRAEVASTSHSLPLPPPIILSHTRLDAPSSGIPPLHLLSNDRKEDRPEVTLPPRKRLGIALGPRYEIRESSSAAAARPAGGIRVDYGFVATMDREIRRDLERDVRYGITDSWDEIVEAMRDTDKVYTRLDDEQTRRQLLAGRLNMLFRDGHAHARTARLMETEARMSREAWGRSMDASDLARAEVMSLRTTVLAQQSKIRELQSADHRR